MHSVSRLGVIGGTSLLDSSLFQDAPQKRYETPFGAVSLIETESMVFLQRHGLERYSPPHRLNHHAHLKAFEQAGVSHVLAVGSVGSLHRHLPPGTMLVPDDFYAPQVNPTFHEDAKGHMAPGFDATWRRTILDSWQEQELSPTPIDGGVYWQTTGPRFETPAEIRAHIPIAHVVGMTVAAECILASELEIPYAAICMIDNMGNGIDPEPISYSAFKAQVHANEKRLIGVIEPLLAAITSKES